MTIKQIDHDLMWEWPIDFCSWNNLIPEEQSAMIEAAAIAEYEIELDSLKLNHIIRI